MSCSVTTTTTPEPNPQHVPLATANENLRKAVVQRIGVEHATVQAAHAASDCCDEPRCETLRPGSDKFLSVLEEVRQMHLRKSHDYGDNADALANIRSSADVINAEPWAGAILRMSDKMHRLKSYFHNGRVEFDGVDDTLLDLCAYSAIALVLYRESQQS